MVRDFPHFVGQAPNVQNLLTKLQLAGLLPPVKPANVGAPAPAGQANAAKSGKAKETKRKEFVIDDEEEVDDGRPVNWTMEHLRRYVFFFTYTSSDHAIS